MELEIKKGEIYKVELPTESLTELQCLDKEDYAAYMYWTFLPSGLPEINDVTVYFGFEINCSQNYFVDEWTAKSFENPKDVIERYIHDAVETLKFRGILTRAIEEHKRELEE